jgi:hypothetical protein
MNTEILNAVDDVADEVLMAMLHFKPSDKQREHREKRGGGWDLVWTEYDAKPYLPENPLFFQDVFNEERLFCADASMLMADPSDQFERFELLQACSGEIAYRWNGMRRRKTRPRAFIRPGCDVFWDSCQRTVYKSGREDIQVNVFGWNKARKIALSCPVPQHKNAVIQGRERTLEKEMTQTLVLMSSVVEDMKVNWSVTIRESSAFTLYSTEEKIKELCALRDAPMTESGRRAAICHWVRAHRRKTQADPVDVRKHLRGVTQFPLGDMQITVTPPSGFCIG